MTYRTCSACYLACSAIALALSGCGKIQEAFSEKPQIGFVALFDTSASTNQQLLRDRYSKEFLGIIDKLAAKGVVARADVIRATPLADTIFPLRVDLPRASLNKNDITQEELITHAKRKAEEGLGNLFSMGAPTPRTRILDAIEVTSRILNGAEMRDIPDRRLVIFSDMIESSERYEFTRGILQPGTIASMVDREKKSGHLPSLTGVRVWIAGAGSGGGENMSSNQLRGIEQFWLRYFRTTGADLPESQYGSSLLNFDISH